MLYGERNIKIDALKRWAKSLSISKESPSYGLFKDQLDVFKDLISKLMPGDYWENVLYSVSHYFMGYFLKRHNSAIRIANYYECFIAPVNIETHKKILAGYPPYTSTGEVILRDNDEIIGSIGEKSDLLWSVFKEYFTVESQYGDISHTLANHDEIMSIQLWNTENMLDSEISEYIDLNLQAADDKLISSLAERIYFFRCAIAHAKGDADMYMAIPEISDTIICGELPLLKKLSFKALQVWGR